MCRGLSGGINIAYLGPAKLPIVGKNCLESYPSRSKTSSKYIIFNGRILSKVLDLCGNGVLQAEKSSAR